MPPRKKRSKEEEDNKTSNNDSDNKKIKNKRNSNNNNDNSINNICIEDNDNIKHFKLKLQQLLSIQNNKELQNIALENSLPTNGTFSDIYNRIQQYYLLKIQLEKESIEKESINSFNKNQPELLIKDGISSGEISFWKVFRSKSLFKNIFSNFKYCQASSYDRLYAVNEILEYFSNGIEIIKDKVKSNSYLKFIDKNSIGDQVDALSLNCPLVLLLKEINNQQQQRQQQEEDIKQFYHNLISNYCNQSFHVQTFLQAIVLSSNIEALKALNQSKCIRNSTCIQFKIYDYQGFEMLDYIFHSFKKLVIDQISISSKINLFGGSFKLGSLIRLVDSLLNNKEYFKLMKIKRINPFTKVIEEDENKNQIKDEFIKNVKSGDVFSDEEMDQDLFQYLKSVSKFYQHYYKTNDGYISNNNNNNGDSYIEDSILEINTNIEKLYLKLYENNKQLSSLFRISFDEKNMKSISKIQNQQIIIQKDIQKLLDDKQLLQNKRRDASSNDNEDNSDGNNISNKQLIIFRYIDMLYSLQDTPWLGNINCRFAKEKNPLEYYLLKTSKDELLDIIKINPGWDKDIFKYGIPNNEIIQILFKRNGEGKSGELYNLKIIELIMKASESFITHQFDNNQHFLENYTGEVIGCINSISMLELMFKKYSDVLFPNNTTNWCYIKDIQILKHCEKLMEDSGRTFRVFSLDQIPAEILLRLINKPELYIGNYTQKLTLVYSNQESVIKLIESGIFKEISLRNLLPVINRKNGTGLIWTRLYRYISSNLITNISDIDSDDDNNKKICIRTYNGTPISLEVTGYQLAEILYFSSRMDDIFKIPKLPVETALALIDRIEVNSLYIQKLFDISIEKEKELDIYSILSSIISRGNLSIIKFLNLNYSYLFSKSTKATSEGVLDFRQLKNLLSIAISNDFIQIVEILLVYSNLTRNEFDKIKTIPNSLINEYLINSFKDNQSKRKFK